jgi:hypothetical protein
MTYPPPPGQTAPPPKPSKKRNGGFALFVALVAAVIAVVSGGIAVWALKKANDAGTTAQQALDRAGAPPPPAPTGGAVPTPSPAPTITSTVPPPTGNPTLDPQAVYEVKYAQQDLKSPTSHWSYIDLDTPRVGDPQDASDIVITGSGLGAATIRFNGVQATSADQPTSTPNECAEGMQFSPIDTAADQSFRQGKSFCVLTSAEAAAKRGDSQQMVVVTVKDVSSDVVVLTASAWRVPR